MPQALRNFSASSEIMSGTSNLPTRPHILLFGHPPNRVARGFSPPAPRMRVRTGRLASGALSTIAGAPIAEGRYSNPWPCPGSVAGRADSPAWCPSAGWPGVAGPAPLASRARWRRDRAAPAVPARPARRSLGSAPPGPAVRLPPRRPVGAVFRPLGLIKTPIHEHPGVLAVPAQLHQAEFPVGQVPARQDEGSIHGRALGLVGGQRVAVIQVGIARGRQRRHPPALVQPDPQRGPRRAGPRSPPPSRAGRS